MYKNILVLFVVLFLTFCILWKDGLLKNLFFTVCFIIALWINIPCFINILNIVDIDDNFVMLPFKLSKEWGVFYTIFVNVILGIILFLQAKFSDNNVYTYKNIKKKYDDFGDDAIELYIIGKDLDFLGKDEFKKQRDRIIHLGNKCKLLCELTTNIDLLNLYKEVCKKGVEIKFYSKSDNVTNLKGQIKVDQNGNKKAIFMSRLNKKYMLLNIENQFLVASILERYVEIYEKSSVSRN